MTTLVIAEHESSVLGCVTLNAIRAATEISFFGNGVVHVLVVGYLCNSVAQSVAEAVGVTEVLYVDSPVHEAALSENVVAQVCAVATRYSHIVCAANARGKNIASQVASFLGVPMIDDVTRVVSSDAFGISIGAWNAIATIRSDDAIKVVAVSPSSFEAARASGGHATVTPIRAIPKCSVTSYLEIDMLKIDRSETQAVSAVVALDRSIGELEDSERQTPPALDMSTAVIRAEQAEVDIGTGSQNTRTGQTGAPFTSQTYPVRNINSRALFGWRGGSQGDGRESIDAVGANYQRVRPCAGG